MFTRHIDLAYHRLIGLLLGPALCVLVLASAPPTGLSQQGWWVGAIALWMAIWWMTEAVPLAATALLPIMMFPLLGLGSMATTAPQYAHPLIFLFLGGFLMARAVNVWGLDHRLALGVMAVMGTSPSRVIAGIMLVTAFLSMWVSNTATSMVMLPIGLSIIATINQFQNADSQDYGPALLLGIAYAATIGGMGTIIGTPPNAFFAAFMAENYGIEISFGRWMLIGVPLLMMLLPLTWVLLTRVVFRVGRETSVQLTNMITEQLTRLAPISNAERMIAGLLLLVAALWIFRPLLNATFPGLHLTDPGIAMIGAVLMFILPADFKMSRRLLSWKDASGIRWDVLILFGGGLALASAIETSGLAAWIGAHLTELGALPQILLLLAIGLLIVFVGEVASNTAMAAVFLPIVGATAMSMGEPVMAFTLPVVLFATLGFMLPVATPPNAVVFGSGALEMRHMLKAGLILDIIGILVVILSILTIGRWIFAVGY